MQRTGSKLSPDPRQTADFLHAKKRKIQDKEVEAFERGLQGEAKAREQAAKAREQAAERHITWRKRKEQDLADELVRISRDTIDRGNRAEIDAQQELDRELERERDRQQDAIDRELAAQANARAEMMLDPIRTDCCSINQPFQHTAEGILG